MDIVCHDHTNTVKTMGVFGRNRYYAEYDCPAPILPGAEDYMTDDVKYKGENLKGLTHSSPYPTSRLSPSIELVELAKEVASADDMLTVQAAGKLRLLAVQIEKLQSSARQILAETKRNQELHRTECGFKKIVGCQYHLYRRPDNSLVFSMIGPGEWGTAAGRVALDFVGTYRLEQDKTWTRVDSGADSEDIHNGDSLYSTG